MRPKPLDRVRDAMRLKHYSYSTEQAYLEWIQRYIYFHERKHPADMAAKHVTAYFLQGKAATLSSKGA